MYRPVRIFKYKLPLPSQYCRCHFCEQQHRRNKKKPPKNQNHHTHYHFVFSGFTSISQTHTQPSVSPHVTSTARGAWFSQDIPLHASRAGHARVLTLRPTSAPARCVHHARSQPIGAEDSGGRGGAGGRVTGGERGNWEGRGFTQVVGGVRLLRRFTHIDYTHSRTPRVGLPKGVRVRALISSLRGPVCLLNELPWTTCCVVLRRRTEIGDSLPLPLPSHPPPPPQKRKEKRKREKEWTKKTASNVLFYFSFLFFNMF